MIQDLQYALRLIRKSPGAAIVAVLTVAIGVGANTAIFSVIRAVLLSPLPYTDADRIVALAESWPNLSGPRPISKLNYRDWAEQNTVFELSAAARWWTVTLSSGDEPVYLVGSLVSPSYFDVFGLHAALGRTFAPGDDQPGHADVVVLSHRLWASQSGSDPGVVGRSVRLDGEVCTVIGVMPARTSVDFYAPALFRPLTFDVIPLRSDHELSAVAKLKHGVTIAQARTEMNAIGDRLANAYPESNKGYGVIVRPFPRPVGLDTEASLYLLFAAVGAVLLIGSVNLANLALARGVARARETAIRAALGAGRWRLVRQVMAEHLVIAVGGGLCGVVVGYGVLLIIKAALPTTGLRAAFPPDTTIAMDGPVWLFALTLSVLSGIGFGLAPANAADAGHSDRQAVSDCRPARRGLREPTGRRVQGREPLIFSRTEPRSDRGPRSQGQRSRRSPTCCRDQPDDGADILPGRAGGADHARTHQCPGVDPCSGGGRRSWAGAGRRRHARPAQN